MEMGAIVERIAMKRRYRFGQFVIIQCKVLAGTREEEEVGLVAVVEDTSLCVEISSVICAERSYRTATFEGVARKRLRFA